MLWFNKQDEGEKTLFARLAVFRGGHSLEAIEEVCGEGLPIDVFDRLSSLVDKSLVQQKESLTGDPRFIFLEMIHEYALEQLKANGEAEVIRSRHTEYLLNWSNTPSRNCGWHAMITGANGLNSNKATSVPPWSGR